MQQRAPTTLSCRRCVQCIHVYCNLWHNWDFVFSTPCFHISLFSFLFFFSLIDCIFSFCFLSTLAWEETPSLSSWWLTRTLSDELAHQLSQEINTWTPDVCASSLSPLLCAFVVRNLFSLLVLFLRYKKLLFCTACTSALPHSHHRLWYSSRLPPKSPPAIPDLPHEVL